MGKFAILGDTHFGASNSSEVLHEYMRKFYKDFFNYIDETGIRTILQLGDLFDVRRHTNTWALNFFKEVFLAEVQKRDLKVYVIIGNHDIYYRESLKISFVEEFLSEFPEHFHIVKEPSDVLIEGISMLLVPWVCKENFNAVQSAISSSSSKFCAGHFEFNGFELFKGQLAKTHHSHEGYKKFEKVFSGHFHHMSSKDNVLYTGTPYELTWQDCNTTKGFFVFDGKTIELVENRHKLYSAIRLSEHESIPKDLVSEKYVKLTVDIALEPKAREALLEKLHSYKPHDIKLIEHKVDNASNKTSYVSTTSISDLIEDYVENTTVSADIDKETLTSLMMSMYVEASANAS